MKILSRDFTVKEKVLILVLVLLLVGLVYYKAVYVPVEESIQSSNTQEQELQTELEIAQAKALALKSKQTEVNEIKNEDGVVSILASYNNSPQETSLLNKILTAAESYNIAFTDITRNSDLIRRSFSLSYTAADYDTAKDILQQLYSSKYRLLISDVAMSGVENESLNDGKVSVQLNATFYETMVGGREDAGLPEDADAVAAAEAAAAEAADTETE